jgi:CPA1 family monovalent cation:H+ antiporter
MEQFLQAETLIIELLLIASIVAIVVQRLRVPYTVALVLVGLLFTLQSDMKIGPAPELILAIFVPPLVFEAAFHLRLDELRHNWRSITALAIPGVVLTMAIVGLVVSWGTGLALPVALLFGATMAATDPVSVVALFKSLGTPKRLAVLVEGESLFGHCRVQTDAGDGADRAVRDADQPARLCYSVHRWPARRPGAGMDRGPGHRAHRRLYD